MNKNKLDFLVARADPNATDTDLATLYSVPTKTPKKGMVTYTTCGAVWGAIAGATFTAKVEAAIANGGEFGAIARFIDKMLSGPGIDPSNPEVPAQSAAFVAAGIATQEQADGVFFNINYPADATVVAQDVADSRLRIARVQAVQVLVSKWQGVNSIVLNGLLTPAMNDLTKPLPTWNDVLADIPQS